MDCMIKNAELIYLTMGEFCGRINITILTSGGYADVL